MSKPKKIWVDAKLYDVPLIIEEEFCRQVNNGLIRNPRVGEIILMFIDNAKGKERQER